MFHRRDFLRRSLTTSSLLACGLHVPAFLGRTAALAPLAGKPGSQDTLLVVVQLTGGNDGLNTVIPFKDPLYAQYRPTLKLPTDQLKKLDDQHGLHPSLEGLAELYQDQALCVVQGVGYPNPSQSHFRSMDIWHAGSTADTLTEGWLGRAMSRMNPAHGFHVGAANEATPLALAGAPAKVPTLTRLEDFQLRTLAGSGTDRQEQKKLIEASVATSDRAGGLLDFVKRTAVSTYASSDRLRELVRGYEPKVAYPETGLGNRLKLVAQLIEANLGARIFYVSIDGFDTHATQAEAHANLLREVSGAITAFHKDLTARGHGDRLLTMTFSEFGRRAKENGSKGTDHGSAAPLFLVGKRVKPGIIGAHPRLDRLDDGNLVHHTDFRQVYAAILDRWLGVPSAEILGSGFKPADVFA
jgi:uncharacterized protein (DUF1501 family)